MTTTNKFQIIGIIGHHNSGKDTLANSLIERGFNRRAFADPLKLFIHELFNIPREILWGPSQNKTGEVRQMLQELGTDYARKFRPNIWVDKTKEAIDIARRQDACGVVVPDVRFVNEAEMLHEQGAILIQIVRPHCTDHETINVNTHASETEHKTIPQQWISHVLHNDGTLEEFNQKVRHLLGEIL